MKILVVVTELPPTRSGVALIASRLVAAYRRAGHEVETLTRADLPALLLGELRLSALPLAWRRIGPGLERYDLIHLHGPAPSFADAFLALSRGCGTPILYTHNFDIDFRFLGPVCRLYERVNRRLVERRAAAVTTSSVAYAGKFDGRRAARAIAWGADHRSLTPPEPRAEGDPLRVLYVGQVRPYKGLDVLLRSLAGLDGVETRVAGGGPFLGTCRRLARRLEIEVSFLGQVSDPELDGCFATSDVLVLPSRTRAEAFGLVLLEGMRAGCIPVASDLPGVAEVVGEAGLLVPPADSEALGACLKRLRDDGELRHRLALRAVERSAAYRWEETERRYVELAEQVAREGSAQRA